MRRDLESLLRDGARRNRRPTPRGLADRVRASVHGQRRVTASPWPVRLGVAALATAALVTLFVVLLPGPTESPTPIDDTLPLQAWLDDTLPSRPLHRSERLLLQEVVLLRTDAENAIDFVLDRIPARVRPLVLLDRML